MVNGRIKIFVLVPSSLNESLFKRQIPRANEYFRALWQVVLADGERDHEEDALMRLLASLLGVNDRDSAIARKEA